MLNLAIYKRLSVAASEDALLSVLLLLVLNKVTMEIEMMEDHLVLVLD